MQTTTEFTVKAMLETVNEPITADRIIDETGLPRSTVYAALKALGAVRTQLGKRVYGYALPDPSTLAFPSVELTPGRIHGKSWKHAAKNAVKAANSVPITTNLSPKDYAVGFEALGKRFLELAAHADHLKDSPDWRIKMGFATDTEKSTP